MALTYEQAGTAGTILCCLCGMNIPPNPANMCGNCIRTQARGRSGGGGAAAGFAAASCKRFAVRDGRGERDGGRRRAAAAGGGRRRDCGGPAVAQRPCASRAAG